MKTAFRCLVAIALLVPLASSAASFEGKVTMNMTGPRGRSMPVTYNLKDGKVRVDMDAGDGRGASMIMDPAKQEAIMLMPQQKRYMLQSITKPNEAANDDAKSPEVKVERTNDHEKILGYDATKYVAKTSDGTTEIWATEALGTFMGLGTGGPMAGPGRRGGRGNATARAWEDAFRGKDAFPLRVVTRSADGGETFRMEATSIEKQNLPDSLFVPPTDYEKFDMGTMMRGMGMPGGMPGGRGRPPAE